MTPFKLAVEIFLIVLGVVWLIIGVLNDNDKMVVTGMFIILMMDSIQLNRRVDKLEKK